MGKPIHDRSAEIDKALPLFKSRGVHHLTEHERQLLRKFGYIEWDRSLRAWKLTDKGAGRMPPSPSRTIATDQHNGYTRRRTYSR